MATTTDTRWLRQIRVLGACPDALEWATEYDDYATMWAACERPDWMLWLIGQTTHDEAGRKRIVLVACEIARLVLPIYEKRNPNGKAPRVAIETVEAWTRGEATIEQVREARRAAYAAAAAAYAAADAAYAAADAAYAAADAAYAADAAAYAAAYAAAAAADAADAYAAAAAYAADAAADAARASMRAKCVEIVRRAYPTPPALGGAS